MRNTVRRFVFLTTLSGFVMFAGGCAAPQGVDAYLVSVRPEPSTTLEQRLAVTLRLQNRGTRPLEVTGAQVRLDVNGSRFATGVSASPFVLEPLGEATTRVTLSVSVFSVLRQVLAGARDKALTYALSGTLHTGGLRSHRFRREGEFSAESLAALSGLSPGP